METMATIIRNAVKGVLDAAPLVHGGRTLRVYGTLPDREFSQRELPIVSLERPRRTESEPWAHRTDRDVYTMQIFAVDSFRPTFDGEQEALERLRVLLAMVEARLRASRDLGLLAYDVMEGFWDFAPESGEAEAAGNNLLRMPGTLTVPVIVEKG